MLDTFLFWTALGYGIDMIINFAVLKLIIKSDASATALTIFGFVHNAFTFGLAFFLGFSLLSLNTGNIEIMGALIPIWVVFSIVLAWLILDLKSYKKIFTFLGVDTSLDWAVGGLSSVPATASLLSFVPQGTIQNAAASFINTIPLSVRWFTLLVGGAVIGIAYMLDRLSGNEDPLETVTDESI